MDREKVDLKKVETAEEVSAESVGVTAEAVERGKQRGAREEDEMDKDGDRLSQEESPLAQGTRKKLFIRTRGSPAHSGTLIPQPKSSHSTSAIASKIEQVSRLVPAMGHNEEVTKGENDNFLEEPYRMDGRENVPLNISASGHNEKASQERNKISIENGKTTSNNSETFDSDSPNIRRFKSKIFESDLILTSRTQNTLNNHQLASSNNVSLVKISSKNNLKLNCNGTPKISDDPAEEEEVEDSAKEPGDNQEAMNEYYSKYLGGEISNNDQSKNSNTGNTEVVTQHASELAEAATSDVEINPNKVQVELRASQNSTFNHPPVKKTSAVSCSRRNESAAANSKNNFDTPNIQGNNNISACNDYYNHTENRNLSNLKTYDWQATKMTVKERLAYLFNNEILADVHFIVGKESQQQRIPAHRFVLSVGSAVFDAMFNCGLANKEEDEINLPDVEPASFLVLLKFLYSDEVQIGPETVMTTLYTAKKYAVPALEKHCVDFLKKNLAADNAFMLLTQARLFDEPQLAALCLETIDKYTPEALNAEGFIDIDVNTLASVLDRDSLRIKEAKLFSAILRWSESECLRLSLPINVDNKRSVLGKVLPKIRFPLMTVEEFAQGPAQSGILTDRECVSLFLHFTVNPKPPVTFLDVPRCSMTGKEQTVCRFQQIESRWGYSGTSDKIRFIVDRRIFVVGFGLYGSIHGPSEYQASIQICNTGTGRQMGANEICFLSDGSNSTFRVMFKEPIEINSNTNYTASATLKGLDSHYGTRGLRKVWVESPMNMGLGVTFQFSYAAGNNNGTSVEDGQIPEIIFYT